MMRKTKKIKLIEATVTYNTQLKRFPLLTSVENKLSQVVTNSIEQLQQLEPNEERNNLWKRFVKMVVDDVESTTLYAIFLYSLHKQQMAPTKGASHYRAPVDTRLKDTIKSKLKNPIPVEEMKQIFNELEKSGIATDGFYTFLNTMLDTIIEAVINGKTEDMLHFLNQQNIDEKTKTMVRNNLTTQ